MIKHGLIFMTLLALFVSPVFGGETEYPLFKQGAGGRAIALGGAFTGVADDPSAVFWNPAGMAQIKSTISLTFTNRLHFQDSKFLEFFATYSDIKYGAFGIGVLSDQTDDILAYDSGFNYLGKFGAYQRAIMVGYAYNLTPVYVGLSLGTVLAGLDPPQGKVSGSGLTVALGLMTRISKNFRIGSTIRPGFSVKYDDTKDETPGNARLGVEFAAKTGISSATDSLRLMVDLDQTNKLPMKVNAGLELTFFKILALRGGINSLNFETRTGKLKTSDLTSANVKYCFGAGITVPASNAGRFVLDFGFMSTRVGSSSAISISWAK